MSTDMVRVVEVQGWRVAVAGIGNEKAKIRDIDLAKKLAYTPPRAVRRLIKRLIADGRLVDVYCRVAVERQSTGNGAERAFEVSEFWLTEEQAMVVIINSGTKVAAEIQDQMIAVFLYVHKNGLPLAGGSAITELQAQTEHLRQMQPYFESAFQQLEDLEGKGEMDHATASAHRTYLLMKVAGIDLTKAPLVKYESVSTVTTLPFKIDNLKTPGNLPPTGFKVRPEVDLSDFRAASRIGDQIGTGITGTMVGYLAKAMGIHRKITTIENEYGLNKPKDIAVGDDVDWWLYSKKSEALLIEVGNVFFEKYTNRPIKKTGMRVFADQAARDWKKAQPLVDPTVPAAAPN